MAILKRTPIYPLYEKYGAKTVEFGGWEMPVQFSSIIDEHLSVRNRAGLFDVSHMGEVEVRGPDTESFLQKLVTNDIERMEKGQVLYTPMCYPDGGIVDDQLIYKMDQNTYILIINAANIQKDVEWMQIHIEGEVEVEDVSDQFALLALQGPTAERILNKLVQEDISSLPPFRFLSNIFLNENPVIISRTGYTGEDGFEIYVENQFAPSLWEELLDVGREEGLVPCGLGARDTLRLEAKLPLYGQELSPTITPLEAGISFAVKEHKHAEFVGKEALSRQRMEGVSRKITGIEMVERGIPRNGYKVYSGEQEIGYVTSGTHSPSLQRNIGLALIAQDYTDLDTIIEVEIRNKRVKAKVIRTPFYQRKVERAYE